MRSRRREYLADIARSGLIPGRVRMSLLRIAGVEAAPGVLIGAGLRLRGGARFVLGAGSGVNFDVSVECNADIVLGRNVSIGPHCVLMTSGHAPGGPDDRCGPVNYKSITIGDGAWLAMNVLVLPGARIGAGAVIAPGSVVRGNVPANTLWAAQGARKYKDLPV